MGTWWRNSDQRCRVVPELTHPSVCHWPGRLMAKLCSLDTVTTSSGCGRCLLPGAARSSAPAPARHAALLKSTGLLLSCTSPVSPLHSASDFRVISYSSLAVQYCTVLYCTVLQS